MSNNEWLACQAQVEDDDNEENYHDNEGEDKNMQLQWVTMSNNEWLAGQAQVGADDNEENHHDNDGEDQIDVIDVIDDMTGWSGKGGGW